MFVMLHWCLVDASLGVLDEVDESILKIEMWIVNPKSN